MVNIVWEKSNETPYAAIGDWIREHQDKLGNIDTVYLVQIWTRYSEDDPWDDITELYDANQGIWENDWWEGQDYVQLLAVAPVCDIDITPKFSVE